MRQLSLSRLASRHRLGYLAMVEESHAIGEDYRYHHALARLDDAGVDFERFVEDLNREASAAHIPAGEAAQETYVLEDVDTAEVLGEFRLRLQIPEPYTRWNGHVGYNIRPGVRGQGLATRGLALVCTLAGVAGLSDLCLMVRPNNLASRRAIEHNGGVLLGDAPVEPGEPPELHYHLVTDRRESV